MALPIPLPAPVTIATFPLNGSMSIVQSMNRLSERWKDSTGLGTRQRSSHDGG